MVVVDTKFQAPSQQEARMYHSSKVYKSGRNDALLWSKIFGQEACQFPAVFAARFEDCEWGHR